MIYLASPYSDPSPIVREHRFEVAQYFTAYWLKRGTIVFSPIVYCHDLAIAHSLPTDFAFWQNFNEKMLNRATELWVLRLPGWENSIGVNSEILRASALALPVTYHDPV